MATLEKDQQNLVFDPAEANHRLFDQRQQQDLFGPALDELASMPAPIEVRHEQGGTADGELDAPPPTFNGGDNEPTDRRSAMLGVVPQVVEEPVRGDRVEDLAACGTEAIDILSCACRSAPERLLLAHKVHASGGEPVGHFTHEGDRDGPLIDQPKAAADPLDVGVEALHRAQSMPVALQQLVGAAFCHRPERRDCVQVPLELSSRELLEVLDVEALLIGLLPPYAERVTPVRLHGGESRASSCLERLPTSGAATRGSGCDEVVSSK